MNPLQAFLHLLSDPNIAFILFTLGFYGIFFELQNPNWVTGILGAFALILAFIGFGSLPLNVAGLLLVGLAIVLFMLEADGDQPRPARHRRPGGLRPGRLGALHRSPATRWRRRSRWPGRSSAVMTVLTALVVVGILYAAWRNRRVPQLVMGVSNIREPLVPLGTEAAVRRDLAARWHRLRGRRGMDGAQRRRQRAGARHARARRGP